MKEEALKLADILEGAEVPNDTQMFEASAMIRRLIEELDKQSEPVAWTWFSSKENTSPYTQMTGYTTECWSWNKPDESVKVDEGTLMPLYTTPQTKPLSDEEILEILADIEHQQWMAWATSIMESENISHERFTRWQNCMVRYSELSEEMKEHDRVWARKVLRAIEERHGIK